MTSRLVLSALLASSALRAQSPPRLPGPDRVRIAEAFRLADALGDGVWPGWSAAPFAVLLVTPATEFLVRHPRPSPEFARVGYDSLLGSEVYARPRVFAPTLLATFPAVGGVPTIVIGEAERTGKRSTAWVLTLLHEHFHQLQNSRPDYFQRALDLGLSGGDQTGMWMLDYPFPYDSAPVRAAVATLGSAAHALAGAAPGDARRAALARYVEARHEVREALSPLDYRYLAFQLWQEGVARYTELAVATLAASRFAPGAAFRALPDYTSFADAAAELRAQVDAARALDLASDRRVAFYPLGAATALALDAAAPGWRGRYFEHPFDLDPLLPDPPSAAAGNSRAP